ncbi:DUF6542 domain-containing protein [Blastococcus sp. TF02A-26]|uniref:DUF6542 domain-containing protein n=1 Tax=Blastococcus sp. TF02A-26 TaxID=2250577 RepID=UPI000DEA5E4C|nr:DUF6542 domain-containing protein [Blastococcus sp. TF02A-26]RBY85260.1 hypothetical protein DQ240_11735 [Blastococcus sp. TF02A-26]
MASASTADTWREAGARSARSAGGPGAPRNARSAPGERPARPPLPPLPPLPSQNRAGSPAQRPPAAASRGAGQGRPVQRPSNPAPDRADRVGPARQHDDRIRATPGYPRASSDLAPDAGPRRGRRDHDDVPDAGSAPRATARPHRAAQTAVPERGSRLRGSVAVLGLLVVGLAAGFVDTMGANTLGLITLVGLVVGTAAATLLVRRRDLTTLVIAPPLVYLAVVGVLKFVHRGPESGPRKVIAEIAAELALGQGFTVMAAATGTALVLALVRWAARR